MKKDKKVFLLFLSSIFIIIFLISIFIGKAYYNKSKYGAQVMGSINNDEIKNTQHSMNYKNIELLKSLNGNMPVSSVCKKVEECIYINLPKIYDSVKDYDATELSNYYKTNIEDVNKKLYISSEKSFINLINKAKNINGDLINDYASCEFKYINNAIQFVVNYKNTKKIEALLIGDNSSTIRFDF